jgi:hypothetical protein
MSTPAAVIFATHAGGETLDRDAKGGNPFASALIELAGGEAQRLGVLAEALRARTHANSAGLQSPQWVDLPVDRLWQWRPAADGSTGARAALVLIVSEYPEAGGWPLFGAARDERRITTCMAANGFAVTAGIAPERAALVQALHTFAARSRTCETAVIYSTGHGVECAGETYLLPADYPFAEGYTAPLLEEHAVPLRLLRDACVARNTNLVFFAGCRTRVGAVGQD